MSQSAPLQIAVDELSRLRRGGGPVTILDVREAWETELCAIDGSLHIPLGALPERVSDIPQDRLVVVLCHHGNRSARATAWLRSQGYANAANLEGESISGRG